MTSSQSDMIAIILDLLPKIDKNENSEEVDNLLSYFYSPHPDLESLLQPIYEFISKKNKKVESDGVLLEQIATAAFMGLKYINSVKSYRSAMGQHDLLLGGDSIGWKVLTEYLYLQAKCDRILVEVKATKGGASFEEFARFCCILSQHMHHAGLGIIFSLKSAKGFPRIDLKKQIKSPKDAWLCQLLFYASEDKPVIIIDAHDMIALSEPGSLPKLLRKKIREISEMTGEWRENDSDTFDEIIVPDYLTAFIPS